MATALQDLSWLDQHPEKCLQANRTWVARVVSEWERQLSRAELERRQKYGQPPVAEKPIADRDVDDLLNRILNPSPLTNPKWAATPQMQGFLFQEQFAVLLRHLSYEVTNRHPVGPDGGIDLEARSPEGRAVLIQIKKHATAVQKKLVEDFHSASFNKAFGLVLPDLWFVAPELTEGARVFCREKSIESKELPELHEIVSQALRNGLDPEALLTLKPAGSPESRNR